MSIRVRAATSNDIAVVSELVHKLLTELTPEGRPGPALDAVQLATTRIIDNPGVWILLAIADNDEAVGVMTLNECTAIYAGGTFGEISELYVRPALRSSGTAPHLLAEASRIGREREWNRIEVGAPSQPRWARTVAFYKRNGFEEVGPRLMLMLA